MLSSVENFNQKNITMNHRNTDKSPNFSAEFTAKLSLCYDFIPTAIASADIIIILPSLP
ncbi:hypothetical protein [Legionella parisiensis]|uniref:Uncharacterized protein n=1 Tax=Legionella parisiensis TaxID=45071 RepID=A0A1E5JTK4_9GAMM|nr:hypothetical protein [Legionella parisiensis]KTD42121.1 hypothetical protein Lpar_3438 [Legionella parisiensis]OEH47378.1 hypothetical protein lpari_01546 [Legionella parisiensis]STX75329.1 Uncharacterised protein [Legionella parisiensis]